MRAWVKDPQTALINQDGNMSIEHSTFVLGDGTATNDSILHMATGTLAKWNNNICVGGYKTLDLASGVTVTQSDKNVYYPQAWFGVNGTLYTNLAQLHAALPLLDVNSV